MSKPSPKKSRTKKNNLLAAVRSRPKTLLILAAFVVAVGATAFVANNNGKQAPTASAQSQVCAQNGKGYCLNNWNNGGTGNPVRMYTGGASNEFFTVVPTNSLCGGFVNSHCPFANKNFDNTFLGDGIVYVKYQPKNNMCLGSKAGDSRGYLEPCGTGTGTYMVRHGSNLIDRYWTDYTGSLHYVCSGGSVGGPVNMNGQSGDIGPCQWR